jgi:hypothetical protein
VMQGRAKQRIGSSAVLYVRIVSCSISYRKLPRVSRTTPFRSWCVNRPFC